MLLYFCGYTSVDIWNSNKKEPPLQDVPMGYLSGTTFLRFLYLTFTKIENKSVSYKDITDTLSKDWGWEIHPLL